MEGKTVDFIKLLLNTDLFKCFSEGELINIFNNDNYFIKTYTKESVIYLQNETCNSMDIILDGNIIIQKIDAEGNVLTISDFTLGDVIGENLLFSSSNKYPMTITAKSKTEILHIKRELILKLCQTNNCFLNIFLKSLSDKSMMLTKKITTLSMNNLRQSIIDFLMYENHRQKSSKIKLNMTKKELSEKIGVQRSSLSRELNNMRADGLIDFDAKHIYIIDINMLNELHKDN
jgi:CRP-like cAMP-binding protein